MVAGLNDPFPPPSAALRGEALRNRAANQPGAPPELLAAAAFVSVLTNEPAEVGAELASRALWRETTHPRARPAGHGSRSRRGFPSRCSPCFGPNDMRRCGHCSMARSRWRGRPGTASGLPEAWPAAAGSRSGSGDLGAAEADARTALAATELPAPAIYRVMNAGLLIKTQVLQGELDAAERTLGPLVLKQRGIAHRRNSSLRTRQAADRTETLGRRPRGLPGRRGRPDPSVCDLSRCPPLAVGGGARRSRARRSRGGRTPRRRGARARPGVRSPARARRGEASRRRRGRR